MGGEVDALEIGSLGDLREGGLRHLLAEGGQALVQLAAGIGSRAAVQVAAGGSRCGAGVWHLVCRSLGDVHILHLASQILGRHLQAATCML